MLHETCGGLHLYNMQLAKQALEQLQLEFLSLQAERIAACQEL
jgi:hypothetical protein